MFTGRFRHQLTAAALAAVGLVLVAACSGGDDDGPLSAAEAGSIATAALLERSDLPEADWDQQEAQAGLDGLVPGGAGDIDLDILPEACQLLEDAMSDLPGLLGDSAPLSTQSRTFSAAGQLLNLDAVSATVAVFEKPADAEAAAAIVEDAFAIDNLEACVQQAIVPAGDDGLQIVEFSFTTPSYALEDSTALTVEIGAIALILPVNVSLDVHAFQRDNVLALYVAVAVNSDQLEDEHAALLTTFANRIEAAQNEAG